MKQVYYNPVMWKRQGNKLIHRITGAEKMIKGKPLLLSDGEAKKIWESYGYNMFGNFGKGSICAVSKTIAKAQREIDIKYYKGANQ